MKDQKIAKRAREPRSGKKIKQVPHGTIGAPLTLRSIESDLDDPKERQELVEEFMKSGHINFRAFLDAKKRDK